MDFPFTYDAAFLTHFINKTVDSKYDGVNLRFALSQSLFSSFDVDEGSKLLLKTIAQRVDMAKIETLLDFGCGTGVLGITLAARHPRLVPDFLDRDALALAFTAYNLKLNGREGGRFFHSAGVMGLPDRCYDLVVSNIPAKAGNGVIEHFLSDLPAFTGGQGLIAVVIVKTLEVLVSETIEKINGNVLCVEERKGYTAFHFSAPASRTPEKSLAPYYRLEKRFAHKKTGWRLKTVFGIPEFDSLSHGTALLVDLFSTTPREGRVLVWNPGQGHLPLFCLQKNAPAALSFTLAGRDRLSLEIARENLLTAGAAEECVSLSPCPSFHDAEGTFETVIVFPDHDPGVPWNTVLVPKALSLLAPGGIAGVAAKSTFMHGLLDQVPGVRVLREKRTRGFRAVLIRER